jgi:UDP-galactopyranose mutase
MNFDNFDIIIIGCGLSGSVIAERYASINKKVLIIDKRNHIGGNCYDYIDKETNILCNKYGPHFFHTNHEDVWKYINKFSNWERYEHKVIGINEGKIFPIPVNITTVNLLCNENIKTTDEMNIWLKKNQNKYEIIEDSEQMSKSLVGEKLYEKIFKNYTYKQWGKYPQELKPEVLARIPLRNNFDDRYFSDKYQVLPTNGYTCFFQNILNNKNITVKLNTDFFNIKNIIPSSKIIIYTGPIDMYFADSGYEKLEYRSLNIIFERYKNMNYYQTHTQVNYTGLDEKFTRITEYKHCLNQKSDDTIISKEFSCEAGEPYYPIFNKKNLELFELYKKMADEESSKRKIHFIGRLANYKYFNMDEAIKNALDYFNKFLYKEE